MKFNKFGLVSETLDPAVGEATSPTGQCPYSELLQDQVAKYEAILKRLEESVQRISRSNKLTAFGKQDAIVAAGHEAVGELRKLVAKTRDVAPEEAFASPNLPYMLRTDLKTFKTPARLPSLKELAEKRGEDLVVVFLRLQELKEHIRKLDVQLQRPLLLQAAAENDVEVLLAASNGHPLTRAVKDAALLQEATEAWVDARLPEEARPIKEVNEVYGTNIKAALAVINKLAGVRADDPVAAAAKGAKDKAATAA